MDIYTKRDIELNYIENQLEEADEIKEYIQKIKMILFTKKGETTDPNFGANLEYLLFNKNLSAQTIENELVKQISVYCPEYNDIKTDIGVNFYIVGSKEECEIIISIENKPIITLKA